MTVAAAIIATLNGTTHELDALRGIDLANEAQESRSFRLTAAAVARVVDAYLAREISADKACTWAFFVRHGFLPTAVLPVTPVDIEWELPREDAIAEATMRLEELGDLVDGELRSGEAEELVRLLRD